MQKGIFFSYTTAYGNIFLVSRVAKQVATLLLQSPINYQLKTMNNFVPTIIVQQHYLGFLVA
jgi:hypothetical protein